MAKQKTGKKPKSAPCDKIRAAKNLRKGASNRADRSRRFQYAIMGYRNGAGHKRD